MKPCFCPFVNKYKDYRGNIYLIFVKLIILNWVVCWIKGDGLFIALLVSY